MNARPPDSAPLRFRFHPSLRDQRMPSVGRMLRRLPRSFWKNLIQYVIGFGLLIIIIIRFWEPTSDRPGLVDVFSQPMDLWPFALACLLWCVSLLMTFIRW